MIAIRSYAPVPSCTTVHVAVSFAGFALLPAALGFLLPLEHAHSVWLTARILHDLLGGTAAIRSPPSTTPVPTSR